MKRDAWSERRRSTKNWMIVGRGKRRRGSAGTPRDRDDRDKNTKDWSADISISKDWSRRETYRLKTRMGSSRVVF